MPKRSTHTYESEKDGISGSDLTVYYCMACGESNLIVGPGVVLTALPKRKTDGAHVLEKGSTVFKLKTVAFETKLLRREKGYERQFRFSCWNCKVPIGYTCEEGDDAKLSYILPDALGSQSDLYLMLYQVPPCIQSTGADTVRVAVEVDTGSSKNAVTSLDNAQVGVGVVAEAREGMANAELIEFMAKVLGVTKNQVQLSRGWSAKSKFVLVSNMVAVDVFRKLRGAVETDLIHVGKVEKFDDASNELGPAATAAGASSSARRQWEQSEDLQELADAPTFKEQTFRN